MTVRTNRGGNGRFVPSIKAAARDFEAAELRVKGRSLQQIADELGYASRGHAHDGIMRAFGALPSEDAEDAKRLDLERIDRLIAKAWDVMEREHIAYSNGQVVRRRTGEYEMDDDGFERLDDQGNRIPVYEEVLDDGPLLAAIDRIEKLIGRRARIFGYEAPSRSRIEVITPETIEAHIAALEADLARNDPADRSPA
jgi:AraC-like DNA-binding protein